MTYGRARLLLGVSGVGFWVVLATLALVGGVPGWVAAQTGGRLAGDVAGVAGLVALVLLAQAPFDVVGGYVLPRVHGRIAGGFGAFAGPWLRGVLAYMGVSLLIGVAMLLASRGAGAAGMVIAGAAASLLLLWLRTPLARVVGGLTTARAPASLGPVVGVLSSPDLGFTGGCAGVVRARTQVIPARWVEALGAERLSLVLRRRREAVDSGLWLRGRLGAVAFTWAGLAVAGMLVGELAGTAGGVLAFAAVFTLWSFAGLLVLPTLSRRASIEVDGRLMEAGVDASELRGLASCLDAMQDDEPRRPGWVEAVFHPIPSVTSRGGRRRRSALAAWDVARTAAFLGLTGLSPLGRAVHCNSGRPALWVYLPLD